MHRGNKNIYSKLSERTGQIAVLIDPDKTHCEEQLKKIAGIYKQPEIDFFFIGGSTVDPQKIDDVCQFLKTNSAVPLLLFPGSSQQLSKHADALLYLTLVSGRNPNYLIEQHVSSSLEVIQMDIEVIPTAYLLIDGGTNSAVARISQTQPIPSYEIELATRTALAAILQGKKIIYLEAGSGALQSIPSAMIQEIQKHTHTPLIVGGGIRNIADLRKYRDLGVHVMVIGNKIEEDLNFIEDVLLYQKEAKLIGTT